MRRFYLLSSTLVLALGCGKDDNSKNKAECHLAAINLSACQRSTLAQVQRSGVWNVNVELNDGTGSAGALRLSGGSGPLMFNMQVTEQESNDDTLYLASESLDSYNRKVRFAVAGCEATASNKMRGTFRRCVDGQLDLQGSFTAARLERREGEAEASGLELVKEVALPRGSASELAVVGGYAYVPAGKEGLFVYDVRNPAEAKKVGEYKPSDDVYFDVAASGTLLYVASQKSGLVIYSIEDPANPKPVRSLTQPSVVFETLSVEGNFLVAGSPAPNGEILVFELTNPAEPKLADRYFVEGAEPSASEVPREVKIHGDRLYASMWTFGLTVSDFKKPSDPKLLGRYSAAPSRGMAVGNVGGRLLAFSSGEDWGSYLSVLDVVNPANILQVGQFRLRQEVSIRSMVLSGSKLYVAYYQDGLRVLDVSNPGDVRQVAYYNTWRETDANRGGSFFEGLTNVVVPGDGYIYATESSRGLLIFRETN
ncbi:LVIVD repeat-containing protein [Myxococcus landrumensis]|uniref:Lipoprotein n=1 Tax=Myxococcus landrumensis TaxID=2813577 RepID=A0ABX7NHC8_9BACT|nr:hypothetical protein [Myxococcus landrumus]QSQ16786.1 hypothetical protein JY572_12345 [Myxococcus landrumus]